MSKRKWESRGKFFTKYACEWLCVCVCVCVCVCIQVERKHEAIKRLARKHAKRAVHAPTPPAPKPVIGCMTHINQTDCSADKCCNW